MDRETALEIKENLKVKFRAVNQIYDITKELDEAFAAGDANSLDMLLDMRMKQINVCLDINRKNEDILNNMSDEREYFLKIVKGENIMDFHDEETKEIYSIAERINKILNKAKDLDRILTTKLENMIE